MKFNLGMLRELREKFYLMQYDICRYIGVSDVAYRTWEHHVRRPNDEHLEKLKAVFLLLDTHADEIGDRESALNVLELEFGDGEE